MKIILILVILASLMGCEGSAEQQTWPVVPEGLKDCQFYRMSNGLNKIRVARCPNSSTSTTYPVGKHYETSVVIDQ